MFATRHSSPAPIGYLQQFVQEFCRKFLQRFHLGLFQRFLLTYRDFFSVTSRKIFTGISPRVPQVTFTGNVVKIISSTPPNILQVISPDIPPKIYLETHIRVTPGNLYRDFCIDAFTHRFHQKQ